MSKVKNYTSPLSIYVVWHSEFKEGEKYASRIYSAFCRDASNPLSRSLSIPVFYRSIFQAGKQEPIEIKFSEAEKNAIVVLVDEEMFNDDAMCEYVRKLNKKTNNDIRLFPISFTPYAFSLDESGLSKQQFINVQNENDTDPDKSFKKKWKIIKSRLCHDFARLLLNFNSSFENKSEENTPVKLFISHAKKDGLHLANEFRNYIETSTKINTFFDANDIADGYDFEDQIKKGLDKNSALVVFLSDEYSDREWCRIEVIVAKRFKIPVVVVYNINIGEKRSFPYLGNVPTIKWNNNNDEIVDLALFQVLANVFWRKNLLNYSTLYVDSDKHHVIEITSPPELFNFIDVQRLKEEMILSKQMSKKDILVLYPDPPLGTEEVNLLNELDSKIEFTTPLLLPNLLK